MTFDASPRRRHAASGGAAFSSDGAGEHGAVCDRRRPGAPEFKYRPPTSTLNHRAGARAGGGSISGSVSLTICFCPSSSTTSMLVRPVGPSSTVTLRGLRMR